MRKDNTPPGHDVMVLVLCGSTHTEPAARFSIVNCTEARAQGDKEGRYLDTSSALVYLDKLLDRRGVLKPKADAASSRDNRIDVAVTSVAKCLKGGKGCWCHRVLLSSRQGHNDSIYRRPDSGSGGHSNRTGEAGVEGESTEAD
jgi:hypothetical protein